MKWKNYEAKNNERNKYIYYKQIKKEEIRRLNE